MRGTNMSNTQELKDYLIGDDGFLLDETHNGKTIMLSGAWGAGKTHFWQNEIEPKLSQELKEDDKSSTYISLYGKDSLNALKQEVFIKASSESSPLSKEVATFGFEALSSIEESDLSIGKVLSAAKGLNNYRKTTKGIKRLKDGGVICFDDFERKSKEIDLNDLFGFISQLAIEYQCKVVIILNSDAFEGEEKKIFKTVKEKTVNKFFYFEPGIEELFYLIANDEKYTPLETYKTDILKAIMETEELNARIYIQVLDNCLEWFSKGYAYTYLRVVVLSTVNFILNNMILAYPYETTVPSESLSGRDIMFYKENMNEYPRNLLRGFNQDCNLSEVEFVHKLLHDMLDNEKISGLQEEEYGAWIKLNEDKLKAIWKYGYRLAFYKDIDEEIYYQIMNFVKLGILPKKNKAEV